MSPFATLLDCMNAVEATAPVAAQGACSELRMHAEAKRLAANARATARSRAAAAKRLLEAGNTLASAGMDVDQDILSDRVMTIMDSADTHAANARYYAELAKQYLRTALSLAS